MSSSLIRVNTITRAETGLVAFLEVIFLDSNLRVISKSISRLLIMGLLYIPTGLIKATNAPKSTRIAVHLWDGAVVGLMIGVLSTTV